MSWKAIIFQATWRIRRQFYLCYFHTLYENQLISFSCGLGTPSDVYLSVNLSALAVEDQLHVHELSLPRLPLPLKCLAKLMPLNLFFSFLSTHFITLVLLLWASLCWSPFMFSAQFMPHFSFLQLLVIRRLEDIFENVTISLKIRGRERMKHKIIWPVELRNLAKLRVESILWESWCTLNWEFNPLIALRFVVENILKICWQSLKIFCETHLSCHKFVIMKDA